MDQKQAQKRKQELKKKAEEIGLYDDKINNNELHTN